MNKNFMYIMTLLPVSKSYENLHTLRGCMWPIFLKILWVDKYWNMVNIRTPSSIDTNLSVQSGDISNFDESEKYI